AGAGRGRGGPALAALGRGLQGGAGRVGELDSPGGAALGAELGLEPALRDAVARAGPPLLRNEVQAEPRRPVGRALRTRQHDDGGAVDVGAEPLLAVDHDAAVADVARGAVHGAAEVGPAVAFGEEHRPVDATVEAAAPEAGETRVADVGRRVRGDEPGDATRHAQAAHEPGVGLGEEITGGGENDSGDGPAPRRLVAREAADVAAGPQGALRFETGGVVEDLV